MISTGRCDELAEVLSSVNFGISKRLMLGECVDVGMVAEVAFGCENLGCVPKVVASPKVGLDRANSGATGAGDIVTRGCGFTTCRGIKWAVSSGGGGAASSMVDSGCGVIGGTGGTEGTVGNVGMGLGPGTTAGFGASTAGGAVGGGAGCGGNASSFMGKGFSRITEGFAVGPGAGSTTFAGGSVVVGGVGSGVVGSGGVSRMGGAKLGAGSGIITSS